MSGYDTREFFVVRENSKRTRGDHHESGDSRLKHQISALEAPIYKEYHDIVMFTKVMRFIHQTITVSTLIKKNYATTCSLDQVRARVDVTLGISEDKVEVYPKHQHGATKFWRRQKSVSYAMDGIVACDVIDKKANSR